MRFLKVFAPAAVIVFGLSLAGCCGSSNTTRETEKATKETEKVVVPTTGGQTTLGDELKDLKDAYDKGAMSQKEYEEAREKILKERGVK